MAGQVGPGETCSVCSPVARGKAHSHSGGAKGGRAREHVIVMPTALAVQIGGCAQRAGARISGVDGHQSPGVRRRQGPQQDRIQRAEHGGVDAHVQCQREHGDRGEAGGLPQDSDAVAQILDELIRRRFPCSWRSFARLGAPPRARLAVASGLCSPSTPNARRFDCQRCGIC